MEIFSDEVWKAFLWNGVHGKCWPQNVYAVVCTEFSSYRAKNNTKKVHAEDNVIDYLEYLLEHKALHHQRLTLFLSASPCQRCTQRIITFLNTARWSYGVTLEMEVVFSAFYQIRRPFCERNRACRNHLPSYDDHRAQVAGLRKLCRTQGVILRTFSYQDWLDLGNCLEVSTINVRWRQYEDDLLKTEFNQFMRFGFTTSSYENYYFQFIESLSTGQFHAENTTQSSTSETCIVFFFIIVAAMLWAFFRASGNS